MSDLAKRLAGPIAGTGSAATLYTVPGSTTAILRHVRVTNTDTSAHTFKMSIGADAAGTRLYSDVSVPANDVLVWTGFEVLAAAETLRWNAPATLTATISGVEVT